MMEHPQQPQEEGGRIGGGDSDISRRGMGVVRRRRHHVEQSFLEDDDGLGETNSWNDHDEEEGRFFGTAKVARGGRSSSRTGSRRGRGKDNSRRPALMFLAQAVLSFVGMVVLPTQLAYEVLVRPPPPSSGAGNHRGAGASPASISLGLGAKSSRDAAEAARGVFTTGGGEGGRRGRPYLSDSGVVWVDRSGTAAVAGEAAGASLRIGRVLQTEEGEGGDSFTYSTRTQFHLCAAAGSELTEGALRTGVVDVFGVEQSQVRALVGLVPLFSRPCVFLIDRHLFWDTCDPVFVLRCFRGLFLQQSTYSYPVQCTKPTSNNLVSHVVDCFSVCIVLLGVGVG